MKFEQMELEFFVTPGDDEHWYDFWVNERKSWWISRLSEHRLKLDHAQQALHIIQKQPQIFFTNTLMVLKNLRAFLIEQTLIWIT